MRIVLAGGGSGGHVFPLIAVTRKLKEISSARSTPLEILFIGPNTFSKSVFAFEGIQAKSIFAGKIRRYLSFLSILDVIKLPLGLAQSYWYLFWFMPDVIFSKGGYGSMPVIFWGVIFRIPTIVHESDSVPGIINRVVAKFAKRVMVSFAESAEFFPRHKTNITGNPVREELFQKIPADPGYVLGMRSKKPIVLILGGSQGAKQINNLVLLGLPDFVKKYEIIHQCGENNLRATESGAMLQIGNLEGKESYHLFPLLNESELASAYSLASVIISRAGSGAIFEIASAGKPSILIPYNSAAGGHQEKNAHIYSETGAASVFEGGNLTPHMLIGEIDSIVGDKKRAQDMSEAAKRFAKPEAARKIAEELVKLAL